MVAATAIAAHTIGLAYQAALSNHTAAVRVVIAALNRRAAASCSISIRKYNPPTLVCKIVANVSRDFASVSPLVRNVRTDSAIITVCIIVHNANQAAVNPASTYLNGPIILSNFAVHLKISPKTKNTGLRAANNKMKAGINILPKTAPRAANKFVSIPTGPDNEPISPNLASNVVSAAIQFPFLPATASASFTLLKKSLVLTNRGRSTNATNLPR